MFDKTDSYRGGGTFGKQPLLQQQHKNPQGKGSGGTSADTQAAPEQPKAVRADGVLNQPKAAFGQKKTGQTIQQPQESASQKADTKRLSPKAQAEVASAFLEDHQKQFKARFGGSLDNWRTFVKQIFGSNKDIAPIATKDKQDGKLKEVRDQIISGALKPEIKFVDDKALVDAEGKQRNAAWDGTSILVRKGLDKASTENAILSEVGHWLEKQLGAKQDTQTKDNKPFDEGEAYKELFSGSGTFSKKVFSNDHHTNNIDGVDTALEFGRKKVKTDGKGSTSKVSSGGNSSQDSSKGVTPQSKDPITDSSSYKHEFSDNVKRFIDEKSLVAVPKALVPAALNGKPATESFATIPRKTIDKLSDDQLVSLLALLNKAEKDHESIDPGHEITDENYDSIGESKTLVENRLKERVNVATTANNVAQEQAAAIDASTLAAINKENEAARRAKADLDSPLLGPILRSIGNEGVAPKSATQIKKIAEEWLGVKLEDAKPNTHKDPSGRSSTLYGWQNDDGTRVFRPPKGKQDGAFNANFQEFSPDGKTVDKNFHIPLEGAPKLKPNDKKAAEDFVKIPTTFGGVKVPKSFLDKGSNGKSNGTRGGVEEHTNPDNPKKRAKPGPSKRQKVEQPTRIQPSREPDPSKPIDKKSVEEIKRLAPEATVREIERVDARLEYIAKNGETEFEGETESLVDYRNELKERASALSDTFKDLDRQLGHIKGPQIRQALQGAAHEANTLKALQLLGFDEVLEQVPLTSPEHQGVIAKADFIAKDGRGRVYILEAKSGNAKLTKNQQAIYPAAENGTAVLAGRDRGDFKRDTPIGQLPVHIVRDPYTKNTPLSPEKLALQIAQQLGIGAPGQGIPVESEQPAQTSTQPPTPSAQPKQSGSSSRSAEAGVSDSRSLGNGVNLENEAKAGVEVETTANDEETSASASGKAEASTGVKKGGTEATVGVVAEGETTAGVLHDTDGDVNLGVELSASGKLAVEGKVKSGPVERTGSAQLTVAAGGKGSVHSKDGVPGAGGEFNLDASATVTGGTTVGDDNNNAGGEISVGVGFGVGAGGHFGTNKEGNFELSGSINLKFIVGGELSFKLEFNPDDVGSALKTAGATITELEQKAAKEIAKAAKKVLSEAKAVGQAWVDLQAQVQQQVIGAVNDVLKQTLSEATGIAKEAIKIVSGPGKQFLESIDSAGKSALKEGIVDKYRGGATVVKPTTNDLVDTTGKFFKKLFGG